MYTGRTLVTHMMNMTNPIAIHVETLMTDSWCYLEKEFTKLIS